MAIKLKVYHAYNGPLLWVLGIGDKGGDRVAYLMEIPLLRG